MGADTTPLADGSEWSVKRGSAAWKTHAQRPASDEAGRQTIPVKRGAKVNLATSPGLRNNRQNGQVRFLRQPMPIVHLLQWSCPVGAHSSRAGHPDRLAGLSSRLVFIGSGNHAPRLLQVAQTGRDSGCRSRDRRRCPGSARLWERLRTRPLPARLQTRPGKASARAGSPRLRQTGLRSVQPAQLGLLRDLLEPVAARHRQRPLPVDDRDGSGTDCPTRRSGRAGRAAASSATGRTGRTGAPTRYSGWPAIASKPVRFC